MKAGKFCQFVMGDMKRAIISKRSVYSNEANEVRRENVSGDEYAER
jgi:hypothetical protein